MSLSSFESVLSSLVNLVKNSEGMSEDYLISKVVEMKLDTRVLVDASKILVRAGNIADKAIAHAPVSRSSLFPAFKPTFVVPAPKPVVVVPAPKPVVVPAPKPVVVVPAPKPAAYQGQSCRSLVSDSFDTKLALDASKEVKLPTAIPEFISALESAHEGNARNDPTFVMALADITKERPKGHWMWYIYPALKEIRGRPPGTARPEFLIPDFGSACELLTQDWFRNNLMTITNAVNSRLERGQSLESIFGGVVDADKFRQAAYMFVLAAQVVGKTSRYNAKEIEEDICNTLLKSLLLTRFNFHDLTFNIAQRWISMQTPRIQASPVQSSYQATTWSYHTCTFGNKIHMKNCEVCGCARKFN